MNRALALCALFVTTMTAACSFKLFEDIGSDPHPPSVEILSLLYYIPPKAPPPASSEARATASQHGKAIFFDSGGFTVNTLQKFLIELRYTDSGGDITKFILRDRDGKLNFSCNPGDLTYFPGISGTVICVENGYDLTGFIGRHRLTLWAEDSHESVSEIVEFVIERIL